MSSHADHILSLYLCGYRKGLSTQQARLSLLEILWIKRDAEELRHLSKTFGKLNHDL